MRKAWHEDAFWNALMPYLHPITGTLALRGPACGCLFSLLSRTWDY